MKMGSHTGGKIISRERADSAKSNSPRSGDDTVSNPLQSKGDGV